MIIDKNFYMQSAEKLAPALVGKLLCRKIENSIIKVRITETECYSGENDTACHARCGKTSRTSIMYESGGIAYVYLCYGLHSLLNVVSGLEGNPEAVLIRCVERYNGPAKLTKALKIDRSFNGKLLTEENNLWIEDDGKRFDYITAPRVGIAYASEKDRNRHWRFILK